MGKGGGRAYEKLKIISQSLLSFFFEVVRVFKQTTVHNVRDFSL